MLMKFNRILVLSPHTDDAELGCGGSLLKWKSQGASIHITCFSSCPESLLPGWDANSTITEFKSVMHEHGFEYSLYNFPVRIFDQYRQRILDTIIRDIESFNPDLLIIPSPGDLHQDHAVISNEGVRAFNGSIICWEPYRGNFVPNFFVSLSLKNVKAKIRMLSTYESQLAKGRRYFSGRMVHAKAIFRGANINTDYAEAFHLIQMISNDIK